MEKLSVDVKQYQSDRADREIQHVIGKEFVNSEVIVSVGEREYQYGAEAFEAQQGKVIEAMNVHRGTQNEPNMDNMKR